MSEYVNWWIFVWLIEWRNEWMNEWMSHEMKLHASLTEWLNELIHEINWWMNGWNNWAMKKWMDNKWKHTCISHTSDFETRCGFPFGLHTRVQSLQTPVYVYLQAIAAWFLWKSYSPFPQGSYPASAGRYWCCLAMSCVFSPLFFSFAQHFYTWRPPPALICKIL